MKNYRVLLISQYFWPEQFTINDVANLLKIKKFKIDVLSSKPNYPEGKFFKDYNFFNKNKEKYKGIKILRCPIIPRGNSSNFRLIINYISFSLFSSIYIFYYIFKKYDYILVYQTSPITSAIAGILFSKIKKIPLIIWVQDLWPETLKGTSHVKSKIVYKIAKIISNYIYKNSDILFAQSKSMVLNLKIKFKNKFVFYLPNLVQTIIKPIKSNSFKKKLNLNNNLNLMFAGNIGDAQNVKLIVNLAKKFKNQKINFLIVGTGSKFETINRLKKKHDLQNLILYGKQEISKIPLYFSIADFMLLTLKNKNVFSITVPNKLIAYMASGKPIISIAPGESSDIVNEAKCGFANKSFSSIDINRIIIKILKIKKKEIKFFSMNSKKYYDLNFSHKSFFEKFEQGIKKYENYKTDLL